MDSDKPRLQVVTALPAARTAQDDLAAALEDLARRIREGTLEADHGVLVLQSVATEKLFPPLRMGRPRTPTETIGLLGYASSRVYDDEIH